MGTFAGRSPGAIMRELIDRMQAAGWRPEFTADRDADGNLWPDHLELPDHGTYSCVEMLEWLRSASVGDIPRDHSEVDGGDGLRIFMYDQPWPGA